MANNHDHFSVASPAMAMAAEEAESLAQNMEQLQKEFTKASRESAKFARGFERDISGAVKGVAIEGKSLSDAIKKIGTSFADRALDAAIKPVSSMASQALTSLFSMGGLGIPNAAPFARGGVLNAPSYFPMASGVGLAGEAGPEAIMPLQRGSDGRLGVAAPAGKPALNVTINITTPDVNGFKKSQAQIGAQIANLVHKSQSD